MDKKFDTYKKALRYAVNLARKINKVHIYIYSFDDLEFLVSIDKHHWPRSHIARGKYFPAINMGRYKFIKVLHYYHRDVYPKKLMKFMDKLGEYQ